MQHQESSDESILDSDIDEDEQIDTSSKLNKRDIKGKIKLQRIQLAHEISKQIDIPSITDIQKELNSPFL